MFFLKRTNVKYVCFDLKQGKICRIKVCGWGLNQTVLLSRNCLALYNVCPLYAISYMVLMGSCKKMGNWNVFQMIRKGEPNSEEVKTWNIKNFNTMYKQQEKSLKCSNRLALTLQIWLRLQITFSTWSLLKLLSGHWMERFSGFQVVFLNYWAILITNILCYWYSWYEVTFLRVFMQIWKFRVN